MAWFTCGYCPEKRINKIQMDEHVQSAHGGPKTIGDAQPVPEEGEASTLLRGMTEQMKTRFDEQVKEISDESSENMVRDQLLDERPRLNVKDQHMTWGGKALPSKVRVYDDRGYERMVPPDIALDRVAFKGWSWPNPGEPKGHRTADWWTSRPCRVCGRAITSDGSRGPEESIIQHEMKRHKSWWEAHANDLNQRTQADIAEAIKLLASQKKEEVLSGSSSSED